MVPVSFYMQLKAQRKQQQQMSLLLWNSVKSFSSCFSNHRLTLLELPFVPHAFLSPAQIIAVDHKPYFSTLVLQTLYDS